ncbi:MAG: choice-of-anchor D domain-containing protein, partial [Chloroherpetonaceae bacterium]
AELGPTEKNASSASVEAREKGESAARMSVKPTDTPVANVIPGTVVRTFTITNIGAGVLNISGITITGPDAAEFSVTASPSSTVPVSGSTTFQITFNPSSDGVKNATVEIANDDSDENPYTFAIRGTGVTSLPLPYFASLNGTAPDWTVQVVNDVGTNPIFALIPSGVTLPDGSSGGAARANFYNASGGRAEVLRMPFIDLTGTTNPILNFDVAYRSFSGEDDRIEVVVSTDGGATYLVGSPVLYNKSRNSTPSLATLGNSSGEFTPTAASDWRHETVDLSQFAGQTDLLIGFRATSAYGNNAWIANVTIQDVPQFATNNVTANGSFSQFGLTINFTDFGGTGGNLYFSRFNNAPTSDASTEYATNTSATAPDGSIFTPNVSAPRWWTVTYDGQVLAATINYSVSIDYTGVPGINNPDRLYIARRSNRFGSWVALPTTRSGTILTATGLTGFSDFTISGLSSENQLPVELVAFTGRKVEQGVELAWRTASEQNNAGFEVQRRSANGGASNAEWQVLGFVRGKGTTTEAQSYSFLDRTASGKVQYRLKQVDFDGQFEYSNIIEVDAGLPKVFALEQNYPNPFNPTTVISYQLPVSSDVSLKVYDVLGKEVMTLVSGRQAAGTYTYTLNASNLASGVYFYRLQASATNGASNATFVQTKKMMLVK